MAVVSSLYHLPDEVAVSVIGNLTPPALLALSQTCTRFRRLINPSRRDILECLLVLECLEEYGGSIPVYGKVVGRSRAANESDIRAWKKLRWACSSCLQLLPHTRFDNKSLFLAEHRKPHPRFAVTQHLITASWGSDKTETISREFLPNPPEPVEEDDIWRMHGGDSGGEEDDDDFQHTLHVGTARRSWGYNRHLRKCIACLYSDSMPPPISYAPNLQYGTHAKIAGVRTRSINALSQLHRYFPGALDRLASEGETLPSQRILKYRQNADWDKVACDQYFVQCPCCQNWKEIRSFHVRGGIPWDKFWKPMFPSQKKVKCPRLVILDRNRDNVCCSVCFADEYGREALGKELVPWFKALVDEDLTAEQGRMHDGWIAIAEGFKTYQKSCTLRQTYRALELVKEVEGILDSRSRSWCLAMTPELSRKLTEQYTKLLPLARELLETGQQTSHSNTAFALWIDHYLDMDAQWNWLEAVKVKVDGDPDLLVDWALEADSHSFNVLDKAATID